MDIKVPKLRRVIYSSSTEVNNYDYFIFSWCWENCNHKFYMSSGYYKEKFVEFECGEDATLFALKFKS